MSERGFRVVRADWRRDHEALRRIRETVFVHGQQVSPELEWDGLDAGCEHVLALDSHGRAIGTARLTPEHAIGRMAVVSDWRGRGVGAAMLETLIERAREKRWPRITLHAQVAAIGFYERFGFRCHGEEFSEAGIRHRHMTRELVATGRAHPCTTWQECREMARQLVGAAQHAICVQSHILLPQVFDNNTLAATMQRLASSSRRASVRLLIRDESALQQRGHRLLDLAQRLPTFVAIRTSVEDEDRTRSDALVTNDRGSFLHFPRDGHADAEVCIGDPRRLAPRQAGFDATWERSVAARSLRPLDI